MARPRVTTRVVHAVLDPSKKAYRAYFEHGGYRDCGTYLEALDATSETRGPAVRVERIDIHVLWRRKPQTAPEERP